MPEQPLHIDAPISSSRALLAGMVSLTLIEGGISTFFLLQCITIVEALLAHIVLIMLATGGVYRLYKARMDITIPLFWLILHAVFGPFGTLISLVMYAVYHPHFPSSGLLDARFSSLFPVEAVSESNKLYERIIFGLDSTVETVNIEPFQDIFAYGSLRQKQTALMKIMRYFRPQFAPILRYALKDREAAIRVQAATIIAKIERDFMKKYLMLGRALQHHPEDREKMLSFALLCDEYAASGLLDEDSKHKSRERAIVLYEKSITLNVYDTNLKLQLGRIYLQAGAYEKAVILFKTCMDEEGLSMPGLLLWYSEALFALKAFTKIRHLAEQHPLAFAELQENSEAREIATMFKSWSEGIPLEKMTLAGFNTTKRIT